MRIKNKNSGKSAVWARFKVEDMKTNAWEQYPILRLKKFNNMGLLKPLVL